MVMVDMGYVPDIPYVPYLCPPPPTLLQPFNSFQHVVALSSSRITVFKRNMNSQAAYTRCGVAVTTISHTVELLSEL